MYVSGGGRYSFQKQQQVRIYAMRLNTFADLLAEGYSITAAAHMLGVSQQMGSKMLKAICQQLGPQAQ